MGKNLCRRHGGSPAGGDVEESALGVHKGLGNHGGANAREAENATAIGEGHPVEALEDAGKIRGELKKVTELIGNGLADLVEGAAGDFLRREAKSAGDGAERSAVSEAEEGSAELVVGRNRGDIGSGDGRGGIEGGGESL